MALYGKNDQEIEAQCSLSIFHTPSTSPPIVIRSNLWIFISKPTMQASAIMMICPDKARRSSPFQHQFHILKLPHTVCSATPRYFHLPPHYEDHTMTTQVSFNKVNLNAINVSTPRFSHLETLW